MEIRFVRWTERPGKTVEAGGGPGTSPSISGPAGGDRHDSIVCPTSAIRHLMKYTQHSPGGLLPAEICRTLEAQALHTGAQLRVAQKIGQRADNLVRRIGIEQER